MKRLPRPPAGAVAAGIALILLVGVVVAAYLAFQLRAPLSPAPARPAPTTSPPAEGLPPYGGAVNNLQASETRNLNDESNALDSIGGGIESSNPSPPPVAARGPCPAVGAWLSPSSCDAAKAAYNATVVGRPHASVPSTMYVGEPGQVTLSVGLPGAGEEAAAEAVKGPGQSPVNLPSGRIGRRMRATLIGVSFDVALENSSDTQDLAPNATWIWKVVPRVQGAQQLVLETTAVFVDVDGKEYVLWRTGEHYPVQVAVRQPHWWERLSNVLTAIPVWLKMFTGIVGAVTALLLAAVAVRSAWGQLTVRKKTRGRPRPGRPGGRSRNP
jgi:hypothetical protein